MDAPVRRFLLALVAMASSAVALAEGAYLPPDLYVVGIRTGTWHQGQTGATFSIVVVNRQSLPPFYWILPTSGVVTVVDTLPPALTATAIAGAGWSCTLAALTCTRADPLPSGSSFPPIVVTIDVASNAPASVTNTFAVSGGGELPFTTGDNRVDDLIDIAGVFPDLAIAKSHAGTFTQGQAGATYNLSVSNAGAGPTTGPVTVVDTLPAGLTATAMTGSGWSCTLANVTCTRSDVLAPGASYPVIVLTVDVSTTAPATLVNVATVTGGGDTNPGNNTASDTTTITAVLPDLAIVKSHTGNFFLGQAGATYMLVVSNAGPGVTSGTVTVVDTLPAGLTATAMAGTGWTCTLATLTCTRADSLAAGASYPPITLTVNVAPTAPGSVVNVVTVSGGGDATPGNSTASDSTVITAASPPQVPIPTLGQWGLLLLMGMLAVAGAGALRRRH